MVTAAAAARFAQMPLQASKDYLFDMFLLRCPGFLCTEYRALSAECCACCTIFLEFGAYTPSIAVYLLASSSPVHVRGFD